MNKKVIDPADIQIHPMKAEGVDSIAVIDRTCFGAPRPEHYREKPSSATNGAGINTSLVAEARTTILQAACKR